ncbi:MAG: LPS export ABC transporter periplasmic protein LptC [Acidobacteriota bacterium]|nr:LPS export ABC transporter periplasmic protein LptC [Acidobacteriota bacterium]
MNSPVAEKIKTPTVAQTAKRRRVSFVELRARFPFVLRYAAIGALILTLILVGVGYWRARNNKDFKMLGGAPQLSNEVVAVINGYERRVTEGDRLKLLVRADKETTYADGRHELDNVFLEVYPADSKNPDRVQAVKAVYTPDQNNPENFVVSFSGNVNFESRDGLKANIEQITYDKQKEIAETLSLINFSRENISGSAVGAVFNVKEKNLVLHNQVEINVAPGGGAAKNSLTDFGSSAVKINSAQATFDQDLARFELNGGALIAVSPQDAASQPTTIRAGKAVYEKDRERMELHGGVEIITASDDLQNIGGEKQQKAATTVPVVIRSQTAIYEQASGKINLSGSANVQQGTELMSGENISANLSKQKKLEKLLTKGGATLRTASGDRTTEVASDELFAQFDLNQQINFATASGSVKIKSVNAENELNIWNSNSLKLDFKPRKGKSLLEKARAEGANTNVSLLTLNSADYSRIEMSTPNFLEILFAAQSEERSVLKQMQTGGRTEIKMFAPQSQGNNPKATNKRLTADQVRLYWNTSGKDLSRAEAVGNADLLVVPLQAASNLDKQQLFASRFDCEFYDSGNLARSFTSSGGSKAVIEPTIVLAERSTRTLTAEKITANFERAAQSVEKLDAIGNAKFNEQDRNGTANSFSYTASDETVRLRGGEPTVWDSRARLKAVEIDSNTRSKISYLRGKVATTYYSQEQTGGAAPFAKVNSPVFLTSNAAEFNHAAGVAVYTGNARAWQDNNFVRAERLILRRDSRSMYGEGKVQSALYNAKRRENGVDKIVPAFAAADKISYSDEQKLLRYESNVDLRQTTERITAGVAEIYLNAANEVSKTVAQNSVAITQPGRKATGDWAQYTAVDEVFLLRGNPAYVEDAEQGNSSGRQVTVYLRENRVVGQGGNSQTTPGRVRSSHKIKKQ